MLKISFYLESKEILGNKLRILWKKITWLKERLNIIKEFYSIPNKVKKGSIAQWIARLDNIAMDLGREV